VGAFACLKVRTGTGRWHAHGTTVLFAVDPEGRQRVNERQLGRGPFRNSPWVWAMVLDHELSWPFQPLVRAHRAYVDRRMWWRADIARLRLGVAADSGPIAGRDMSGRLRRCVLVATVAIVGVLNAGAARADARGSVDLGTLGGSWSEPVAVNSAGHVIGDSETVDHRVHAFLADASRMVDLGSLARRSSYAVAINSSDTVVGYAEHKYYPTRGFIWRHGVMTDLGSLGGSGTVAGGLNDRDQVVGASRTADRRRHAFLWSAGQMIDLAPRSRCSFANAINDRGEVVGVFANDEYCAQQHIFLWQSHICSTTRTRCPEIRHAASTPGIPRSTTPG
jgi:probable HAF family extracellular repeat protein